MPEANLHFSVIPERKLIWLFCGLAALHVFIFSAAFPFFNNVDEQMHFDLTLKYAHGKIPRGMEPVSREAVKYLAIYGSAFYLGRENRPERQPPPWTWPSNRLAPFLQYCEIHWHPINYESSQPPLYYALAGTCWRLGALLRLNGGNRLYGLRFLNVPIVVVVVWLGWLTARLIFPNEIFPRLAVPALLSVFPQSAFYSIQNDVLSPLCFGAVFLCLVKWSRAPNPGAGLGAATGFALAATFLTKMSNLPLLAVAAAFIGFQFIRFWRTRKLRSAALAFLLLALCAMLPAAAWMAWSKAYFGDYLGTKQKIALLGWTVKPFAEWWQHPIFTIHGAWIFFSELFANFWQGEMVYHGQSMKFFGANVFYTVVTLVLPIIAIVGRKPGGALWLAFLSFAAAIAFLGIVSVIYDFHNCPAPSRAHPYLSSGRLMLGALVPFGVMFAAGLDRGLNWLRLKTPLKFAALGLFLLGVLLIEIVTDLPAFRDGYNWFHM